MTFKKKAFTLIELLVVIAIIGILASIIVVSYNNVQERSRISKAKADISSIRSGIDMMYADTKEYPFHYQSDCKDARFSTDPAVVAGASSYSNGDYEIPVVPYNTAERIESTGSVITTKTDLAKKMGLLENDTTPAYKNWGGPYIDQIPEKDPWNNFYWFDPDYICSEYTNTAGSTIAVTAGANDLACKGHTKSEVRAIMSYGPTKGTAAGGDYYGLDNISTLVCSK